MSSPEEAIRRVVDAFERSDWSEIDVRWGNVRVHLSAATASARLEATSSGGAVDQVPPADEPPSASAGEVTRREVPAVTPPAGAHVVVAPSPGIFWRSPEPGLPPFAEVGDDVDAAATVCIVEVMKLMNTVRAGVRGTVEQILARDGALVEYGEALLRVRTA